MAAGFYYKTFMWPASFWEKVYEPLIRRAAGLGRAAGVDDPDTYEKAYAHCDVLVIGGGAAGLMAALAAGRSGARVILVDEDFVMGGRALAERREIDRIGAAEWAAQTVAELAAMPEVRLMAAHHGVRRLRRRRLWRGRARQRSPGRAARLPAAATQLADHGEARGAMRRRRSSGRWCSATTTAPA